MQALILVILSTFLFHPPQAPPVMTRNMNLVHDAVARTLDERRTEQRFRGSLPATTVVEASYVSSSGLLKRGFVYVPPSFHFVLVRVSSVNAHHQHIVNSYAYDPVTHLLRFQRQQTMDPNPGGPCPQ